MTSLSRRFLLLLLSVFILSACSGDKSISLSRDEFQSLIDEGFQAPRIVTLELPMSARAQLYLQTPEIALGDSRKSVNWDINGEVDIDVADKFTFGKMSLALAGKADLQIDPADQAVFMTNVAITGKDITVTSNLVQMLVLDALAEQVARGLNDILLFSVPERSPLAALMGANGVKYQVEPEGIVFSPSPAAAP